MRKYDHLQREMEAVSNLVSRDKEDKPAVREVKRKKDTTISEGNADESSRDFESVYTFLKNEDWYQPPFKTVEAKLETTQQEKSYIPNLSTVEPKQNPGLNLRESNADSLLEPIEGAPTPTTSKVEHRISVNESAPRPTVIQRVQQELRSRIERFLPK
jgi:hypothetical protein